MTNPPKSVLDLAQEAGFSEVKNVEHHYRQLWLERITKLCEAYAAQVLDTLKQSIELPEPAMQESDPYHVTDCVDGGVPKVLSWWDKDQLQQTVVGAVLREQEVAVSKGIELMASLSKQQDLAVACEELRSKVTQLEAENVSNMDTCQGVICGLTAEVERLTTVIDDLASLKGAAPPAETTYEQYLAIRESHLNAAEEAYFDVRPQVDSAASRRIFYAGHSKGYDAAMSTAKETANENATKTDNPQVQEV